MRRFVALAVLVFGVWGNAPAPEPPAASTASGCSTASATIAFDFDGAPQSRCVIEGERTFAVIVSPEHLPPINPSPWYAFRYSAQPGAPVTVHLRYMLARHRYPPKWHGTGDATLLAASVSDDGRSATLVLPPGEGTVSAQELFDGARHARLLYELAQSASVERITLGQSLDRRPVEGLRIGRHDAPRLVVLLGRAHPPEVSGAMAMESFLRTIVQSVEAGDLADVQFLAVPLLNPDGVARGHWRANLGGRDLNRDWGEFSQPETRAIAEWLSSLPPDVRLLAMVDFHSTDRNLFYVQGQEETDRVEEQFLDRWLVGQEAAVSCYPFTIERRNANPGSGTSKNWFHAVYGIPAYTFEVGDETDRACLKGAAESIAKRFVSALAGLETWESR